MPKQAMAMRIDPGAAQYIVEKAFEEGLINQRKIDHYMDEMRTDIATLERRLEELRSAGGNTFMVPNRRGRPPGSMNKNNGAKKAGARRRHGPVTAEQIATRQLQGRYLGFMRQISASKRPRFQRIAKEQGREAAISAMRTELGK